MRALRRLARPDADLRQQDRPARRRSRTRVAGHRCHRPTRGASRRPARSSGRSPGSAADGRRRETFFRRTRASATTPACCTPRPTPTDRLSATVFKIERGPAGEKTSYVRMFRGRCARATGPMGPQRRSEGDRHQRGACRHRRSAVAAVSAGEIAQVWGLSAVRVGDTIGAEPPRAAHARSSRRRRSKRSSCPPRVADRRALRGTLARTSPSKTR